MSEGTIDDVLAGRATWVLVQGDCREVLPTLPDKSVAHVITDPPYEAEAHTSLRRVLDGTRPGKAVGWKADDQWHEAALDFPPLTGDERAYSGIEIARVTQRWALVFCQTEASQRWRHALEAGGAGMKYRRTAIWVKPDGQPQLSGDRPGVGYESICICHASARRSAWNGGGRCGVFTHVKNVTGSRESAPHPTTKPTALMLELVELFTDPGELVLDPFAGSGTTGVACLRLGRRVILIERERRYADIARERMRAEERGLSLREARLGQSSIFDVLGGT